MATFTALAKILSIEFYCNTKTDGFGEILNLWLYGMSEEIQNPYYAYQSVSLWVIVCPYIRVVVLKKNGGNHKGMIPISNMFVMIAGHSHNNSNNGWGS